MINKDLELVRNTEKEFLLEPDFEDVGDWEMMDEEEFKEESEKLKETIKEDESVVSRFSMDENVMGMGQVQKEWQEWLASCLE